MQIIQQSLFSVTTVTKYKSALPRSIPLFSSSRLIIAYMSLNSVKSWIFTLKVKEKDYLFFFGFILAFFCTLFLINPPRYPCPSPAAGPSLLPLSSLIPQCVLVATASVCSEWLLHGPSMCPVAHFQISGCCQHWLGKIGKWMGVSLLSWGTWILVLSFDWPAIT